MSLREPSFTLKPNMIGFNSLFFTPKVHLKAKINSFLSFYVIQLLSADGAMF